MNGSNSNSKAKMAVPSSKRRKLKHSSSEEESQDRMETEELEQDSASEGSEEKEEDATSKHKTPVVRQTTRIFNEALYSGAQHKSSMFKLQIDSMLDEISPKYEKYSSTINGALGKIKTMIEGIPDREPLGVSISQQICEIGDADME